MSTLPLSLKIPDSVPQCPFLELPKELKAYIFSFLETGREFEETCREFYSISKVHGRFQHSPHCSAYSELGDALEKPLIDLIQAAATESSVHFGTQPRPPHFPSNLDQFYSQFKVRIAQLNINSLHPEFSLYIDAVRGKIAHSPLSFRKRNALVKHLNEKILVDLVNAYAEQPLEKITIDNFKQKAAEMGRMIPTHDSIDIETLMRKAIRACHESSMQRHISELKALHEKPIDGDENLFQEIDRNIRFFKELALDIESFNQADRFRFLHEIYNS